MIEEHAGAWTSRVVRARPEEFYAAFLDPSALIDWLPPAEMTGEICEFDARVGGGHRMSLFYPPDERGFRGKTFGQGGHGQRAVRGTDASMQDRRGRQLRHDRSGLLRREMMTATFEEVSGETEVTLVCQNLPPGLRVEDNEAGSRLSLQQLARRFE
jgi:uncharacterized protein YndB with AHSA1/START domain